MSAEQRNPTNPNLLQASKYLLTFPNIEDTTYFLQSVNIPGISIYSGEQATPFANRKIPGSKPIFEDLRCSFLVSEDLNSWIKIYKWIKALSEVEGFPDYNKMEFLNKRQNFSYDKKLPQYGEATLTILNNLNNPKIRINFIDIFPTNLSGIDFSTTTDADNIIVADGIFKYTSYNIEIL